MIILHQISKPLHEAVKDINATGLSNLVFQIVVWPHSSDCTTFIFKDDSYSQACSIHTQLGRREPTINEWIGQ
jgi:hypothetical protein